MNLNNANLSATKEGEEFLNYLVNLVETFSLVMSENNANKHLRFDDYTNQMKEGIKRAVEDKSITIYQEEKLSKQTTKAYFVEQVFNVFGYRLEGDAADIVLNILAVMKVHQRNMAHDFLTSLFKDR